MSVGLSSALKRGPNYILSFIIVFLATQSLGGLFGQAVFGTFITIREKFHSNILAESIVLSNPLVVQRVGQLTAGYSRSITDGTLLNAEGIALLSQQTTREANILAYNDAFLLIAGISLFALIILLTHVSLRALFRNRETVLAIQTS